MAATAEAHNADLKTLNGRHYPMLKGLKPPCRYLTFTSILCHSTIAVDAFVGTQEEQRSQHEGLEKSKPIL